MINSSTINTDRTVEELITWYPVGAMRLDNQLNIPCVLSAAPTAAGAAVQMVGDYKSRSSPPYLMAVGNTVLGVARQVPHGLLVYFASTNALHSAVENWTATGLMAALGGSHQPAAASCLQL